MFSKITSQLAVASVYDEIPSGWHILDVRGLIDGTGNPPSLIEHYVASGLRILEAQSQKLVVVCDYGQSRSNFIAARINAARQTISFHESLNGVRDAHPDSQVNPAFLRGSKLTVESTSIAKVAVSGGSGLIGSHLEVELQKLGAECRVLTRQHHGKYLSNSESLRTAIGDVRPDLFVHLAHPKPVNAEQSLKDALTQLITVANYCEDHGVPLAYLSGWVVFDGSTVPTVDCSMEPAPRSRYGRLKAMSEAYLRASTGSIESRIIRLPAIFSHCSLEPRLLQYFARCARNGEDIIFHEFTNGSARVPLVNVEACVRALAKALINFQTLPPLLHLGHASQSPTVSEIARMMADSVGIAARGVTVERSVFNGHFQPDIEIPRTAEAMTELMQFMNDLHHANA